MTVNDALMVVMYKQNQDDESKKISAPKVDPETSKSNGVDQDDEEDAEDDQVSMSVVLQWSETADKPEIRVAHQFPGKGDPFQRPRQNGVMLDKSLTLPSESLTHADMDLLRRARLTY